MIKESPVICAPPKKNKLEAAIWAPDEVALALEHMEKMADTFMHLAVHMVFICCSMRNGEAVALTKGYIELDKSRIKINKTLQRVRRKEFEDMPKDDLIFVFSYKEPDSNSVLILKNQKRIPANGMFL